MKTLPQTEVLTADFPYRNVISFYLAILKVYPKLKKGLITLGQTPSAMVEVYDTVFNKVIHFYAVIGQTKENYILTNDEKPA